MSVIDHTGQTFGRLTVTGPDEEAGWWLCTCQCGTVCAKRGKYLRSGMTTSCGCYQREQATIVLSKVRAEGVMRRTAEPGVWDEKMIQALRDLHAEGHSMTEIGERLGMTKNAIVGKARRLNLDARPSPIRRAGDPKPPAIPRAKPTERPAPSPRIVAPRVVQKPVFVAPVPVVIKPVQFSSSRTCTWVGGATGPDGPCDDRAVYGTAWCDDHGRRCYQVWPPRVREVAA